MQAVLIILTQKEPDIAHNHIRKELLKYCPFQDYERDY
jgi:hypothetical protein